MNRLIKQFLAVACAAMLNLASPAANAILLSFSPSSQTITNGNTAAVDIVLSGLGASNEILSAFDLDVVFDPAILGNPNINLNLPLFGGSADTLSSINISSGRLDFALTSFLFDDDLLALQSDSVVLASLLFTGTGVGSSNLEFDFADPSNLLVGKNGLPLAVDVASGSITVDPRSGGSVPEPGSLALVLSCLLASAAVIKLRRR